MIQKRRNVMNLPKVSHFTSQGLLFAAAAIASLVFAATASGQVVAYDDAGNYLTNSWWTNGANQGFGFTGWTIITNGPNFHGNYVKAAYVIPPFANASVTNVAGVNYTNVWGIFANGTTTNNPNINETIATRGFASPLGTNTFKLQWGSKGAGNTRVIVNNVTNTVHGWCGFTLRNGNATNSSADFQTGARFYLYFLDGASPSTLYVGDGSAGSPISVTGTSFSDLGRGNITNAVESEITVGADNTSYHLVLKDVVQNKTLFTLDSLLVGSGTIANAELFCHDTSHDQN